MTPTITAFASSPDRGRGLARDMRVRWALEEVGQPYDVRLVSFSEMKQPAHLALHPFGQIPTYEEGDLTLFEIRRDHPAYRRAPCRPAARRRECPGARDRLDVRRAQHGRAADRRARKAEYAEARQALVRRSALPIIEDRIRGRLDELSRRLGDADWLDGEFSAGDLMMVMVLRRPEGIGIARRLSEPCGLCRPRRGAAAPISARSTTNMRFSPRTSRPPNRDYAAGRSSLRTRSGMGSASSIARSDAPGSWRWLISEFISVSSALEQMPSTSASSQPSSAM